MNSVTLPCHAYLMSYFYSKLNPIKMANQYQREVELQYVNSSDHINTCTVFKHCHTCSIYKNVDNFF